MNKYRLTFEFFDTIEQAQNFKNKILAKVNYYYRTHKKISITPWTSHDKTENKIICWYYI